MEERVNLFVPAALVQGLRIPATALTDGSPQPLWRHVRATLNRKFLLPYDVKTAARLAWHLRSPVDRRLLGVVVLTPWALSLVVHLPKAFALLFYLPAVAVLIPLTRYTVRVVPALTPLGDLYLPGVHPAAAAGWIAGNPGVLAVTRRPSFHRFPRPFYAISGASLLLLTTGAAVLLFSQGESSWQWKLLAAPVFAAFGLLYQSVRR